MIGALVQAMQSTVTIEPVTGQGNAGEQSSFLPSPLCNLPGDMETILSNYLPPFIHKALGVFKKCIQTSPAGAQSGDNGTQLNQYR
jgi:hypothetical protein